MTTVTDARKSVKPPRTIRVLEPVAPDSAGWMAMRISEGKRHDIYLVAGVRCDIGGNAFRVEKLTADLTTVETYFVRLGDADQCVCDCKWSTLGKTTHVKPCRHIAGLKALDAAGKLPRKQKYGACNHCRQRIDGPGLCDDCQSAEDTFACVHQADEMALAGA